MKEKPVLNKRELERFNQYLKQDGEHVLWTAGTSTDGYGTFKLKGKTVRVHVIAFLLANPNFEYKNTTQVCHTCDILICCRPEHLFAGTYSSNMKDAVTKGRHIGGARKLSLEQVEEIRFLYKIYAYAGPTEAKKTLANMYNVSYANIHNILFVRKGALT